jgi:hypothetical protein
MLQSELMNNMRKGGLGTSGKAKLCQLSRACLAMRSDTPLITPPFGWFADFRKNRANLAQFCGNAEMGYFLQNVAYRDLLKPSQP